jgi:hypothetical protein
MGREASPRPAGGKAMQDANFRGYAKLASGLL